MPSLLSPTEFNETWANTAEKSRADGLLGVLGVVAPVSARRALDAR